MPRQVPHTALPARYRRLGVLLAAAVAVQLAVALPHAEARPDPDKSNKPDDLIGAAEVGSLEASPVALAAAEPLAPAPAPTPTPAPAPAPSVWPPTSSTGTVATTSAASVTPAPAAPHGGSGAQAVGGGNSCKPHEPPKGWKKGANKPKTPKKPKPNCPDTGTAEEPPATAPPTRGQQPVPPADPAAGPLPASDTPIAPADQGEGAAAAAAPGAGGAAGSGEGAGGDGGAAAPPSEQALPSASDRDQRSGRERLIDATRSFTALFVLAALVGGFLLLQGRFTRRDPRLVVAPVDGDYLDFE